MEPNVKPPVENTNLTSSVSDAEFDVLLDNFREMMESKKRVYVEDEWDNIHGDMIHF